MVTPRIIGNRIGSPFSGINSNRRRIIVTGSIVKASNPVIIAARFLPSFLDTIGEITRPIIAEMTTDKEIAAYCSVEKPQKNELR